ncbi:hypothetical protein MTR_2g032735 [Medicago truncatula]|uniref:Uncharacterized protein n=1 Tax=Medicago truncatula TaxID=3880 RepID=A0A072V5M7_MEDTR|nr:hypothetical protein MTR_2g032735 [Medicago truncatula]
MEVSMIRKGVVMMLIVTHVECNSPSKNLGQLSSKDSQEHGARAVVHTECDSSLEICNNNK